MADALLNIQTKGAKIIQPYAVAIGVPQIRITPYWKHGPNGPKEVNSTGDGLVELSSANAKLAATQLMVQSRKPILDQSFSIGGLSSVTFRSEKEQKEIKSGWPESTDLTIPISVSTSVECTARELSPYMSAILSGQKAPEELSSTLDANTGYEIGLGNSTISEYHRVEIWYDFPLDGKRMVIVLPKAQITSNEELSFNPSDEMGITFTITAGTASFGTDDIAVSTWNDAPHGTKLFLDSGNPVTGADDPTLFTEYQIGSYVAVPTVNATPVNKRDESKEAYAVVTDGALANIKLLKRGVHPVTTSTFGAAGSVVYTSS